METHLSIFRDFVWTSFMDAPKGINFEIWHRFITYSTFSSKQILMTFVFLQSSFNDFYRNKIKLEAGFASTGSVSKEFGNLTASASLVTF